MFKDEKLAEVRIEVSWRRFIVRKHGVGKSFQEFIFFQFSMSSSPLITGVVLGCFIKAVVGSS
jgi:hypothetical protein